MPYPLGRIVRHDPRSRAYAYTAANPLISVRWIRHAPIFDQGNIGSCTSNACLGALGTGPLYDALKSRPTYNEIEAVHLYSQATMLDDAPGSYPPDDTGSSGLAVAKAAQNDGWLSGYQHAFDFTAALSALAAGPLIVGVDWYAGFDTPAKTGECVLSGSVRGGHELCVDTLDVENQRVWFTNSWGESWGTFGRAFWTFATFEKLLAADGDATILTPVTAPAPVPNPPNPTPNPDGCFAAILKPWTLLHHTGKDATVAKAGRTWLAAKGL